MQSHLLLSRLFAATSVALALLAPAAHAQPAERPTHSFGAGRPIAGQYIVTFKPGTNGRSEATAIAQAHAGRVLRSYSHALQGFSAALPDAAVEALGRNPNIERIEQDQTVSLQQLASPQNNATWGLDRIDQASLPLDTQYRFSGNGAGVTAFIIDTGMRADHAEFAGRVQSGYDAIGDGNGTNDCNGHGTHVAGTVGGSTWGVAKQVSLVPVRVLDCAGAGAWSDVIAGIDWVANSTVRPAVANMSLGGSASAAVNAAVAGAVAKGVVMVVAAGNKNVDACTASPAGEPSAITVGASTSIDYRASFSNWGSCVDVFAPGAGITSSWHTGDTATNTIGGTSMAAPHAAGVAALLLQANPSATPAAVADAIRLGATPSRLAAVSLGTGSPNLLLFSVVAAAPEPAIRTVAFRGMTGSAVRSGGNWKASATVSVRDVASGAAIANARISGTFSPGGASGCVTGPGGSCTLTSSAIKVSAAASTTFTGTGISGTELHYDATQNPVSQIVIQRP